MNRCVFFFDIDGTLATYQKPISIPLQKKLQELKTVGHKLFLCTGRGYSDLPNDILSVGFDGMICSTGAYLRIHDKVIWEKAFPLPLLLELQDYFKNLKISAYFEGSKTIYRAEQDEKLEEQFPPIEELLQQNPTTMDSIYSATFHLKQKELILAISIWVKAHHLNFFMQTELHGDIIMNGCNKATGIKKMISYSNLGDWKTIAFGDSPNDIEMFQAVDISVAMGHAPDKVKKYASYVTGSFEEDGVLQFLNSYNF